MHPSFEEFMEILKELFPEKDLQSVTDATNIRTEFILDSLEIMFLTVALDERFAIDLNAMSTAQTVGELRACISSVSHNGRHIPDEL